MSTQVATASLAEQVVKKLMDKNFTIATAESCTGGLIAAALTDIPGASKVLYGGFVTYSNEAKSNMIHVQARTIQDYGAVSAQVARAMAEGAHSTARTHVTVAVTGVAGPSGGSKRKPVGLVHIACATNEKTNLVEKRFGDIGRDEIRRSAVDAALVLVLETLNETPE